MNAMPTIRRHIAANAPILRDGEAFLRLAKNIDAPIFSYLFMHNKKCHDLLEVIQ
jgi:ubiquinone biosynthesis protein Coq4